MGGIIEKPWGREEVLYEEDGLKVKRLTVFAGKRTSLQFHEYRSEFMVCIGGHGHVLIGDTVYDTTSIQIDAKEVHRIIADEEQDFTLIEVQRGMICDDNDIIRIADDFNRK